MVSSFMNFMFKNYIIAILILFISAKVQAEPSNIYPLIEEYHNYSEILPELRYIESLNPDICRIDIIGYSSNEHLPIYALKISHNAIFDEDYDPNLLFCGQHQSEEVLGVEIVLENAERLVLNYKHNDFITDIVNTYELWFVPTVNPEGFRIVSNGLSSTKRKNNTDTNWNGVPEIEDDGVDLNKNYPFNWQYDDISEPDYRYYKGYQACSQTEVQTMMKFFDERKFAAAIFYHSSQTGNQSERIFYPWKWDYEFSPDYYTMHDIAERIADKLPRDYLPGNYEVHNMNNNKKGYARDYIYSRFNTYAFTIETGGNTSEGISIIHPGSEFLNKIKEKHYQAFLEFLKQCREHLFYGYVENYNPDKETKISIVEKPDLSPIIPNSEGYFFRLLPKRNLPYNFIIDKTIHKVYFSDNLRQYEFKLKE